MIQRTAPRMGYTLLEVILAIGIGLLLVAALYVALDVQMRYQQSGREAIVDAQMARGLLQRMAVDIRQSMGMLMTNPTVTASMQAMLSSQTGATNSSSGSTGGSGPTGQQAATLGTTQYSFGLVGSETELSLYQSVLPRYSAMVADSAMTTCDQRRVTYSLFDGVGLVRQESRSIAEDGGEEADVPPQVLATEVLELRFRYFDGTTNAWQTTWDGTVQGPPLAVEITLTLEPPRDVGRARAQPKAPTQHRLVVAIPAATLIDTSLMQP